MTAPAAPSLDPAETAHTAWARQVLMRQTEMLGELAEVGLEVAKAAGRRAVARAEGEPDGAAAEGDNLAMAYARAARAVRLTLMLQARVVAEIGKLDLADQARAEAVRAAQEEAETRATPEYAHKARVERVVLRVAKDAHPDNEDEVDRLISEAGERLDDDDLYRDILSRPVGELVGAICRDLGLDPDWTRLAQEPWAVDEQADPRSPFASTSPIAVAMAGGGPLPEERAVEGASGFQPRQRPDFHAAFP
jgi:hypothetical protein